MWMIYITADLCYGPFPTSAAAHEYAIQYKLRDYRIQEIWSAEDILRREG